MSRRPLSTNAGVPLIESRMRCTVDRTGRASGAEEVEQMGSLGRVELERVRDPVDDAL
jgi:hypothetical protein